MIEQKTIAVPGAFNAIVAKLIERAGFDACYVSGAGLANSAGLPDVGLLTMTEVVTQAKLIAEAVTIPCICDADTGFGEAINAARAVHEFECAGIAGIHIEDQEFPKKCGHLEGKRLISVEAMNEKLRAAVGAKSNPDFLIIARTDSRAVEGFDAAVERARQYIEAGADAIFPEALETRAEFALFKEKLGKNVILSANMTEFGRTPYLSVDDFAVLGYRIVIFPLTAFRVMLKTVNEVLQDLKNEGSQKNMLDQMMTRKELYDLLDYDHGVPIAPRNPLNPLPESADLT